MNLKRFDNTTKFISHMKVYKKENQNRIIHKYRGLLAEVDDQVDSIIQFCQSPKSLSEIEFEFGSDINNHISLLLEYRILERFKTNYDFSLNTNDIQLRLFVTEQCNFNCSYCYESLSDRMDGKSMTIGTADKAIYFFDRYIKENWNHEGKIQIRIYGGEPLLDINLVKHIILKCKSVLQSNGDLIFYLNTNGFLLSPEITAYLKANSVITIVSLDGLVQHNVNRTLKNGFETYNIVVDKISQAIKNGLKLAINVTVTNKNINNLKEIIDEFSSFGVEDISLNCLKPGPNFSSNSIDDNYYDSFAKKAWEAYKYGTRKGLIIGGLWLRLKERLVEGSPFYCSACGNEFGVSPTGDLYPCPHVYGIDKFKIGNIVTNSINYNILDQWKSRSAMIIDDCKNCNYCGICSGGCPAVALFSEGEINLPENCSTHKYLIEQLIWDVKI